VDKKAGEPLTADDIAPYPLPPNARVVEEVVEHWFPNVESTLSVLRPSDTSWAATGWISSRRFFHSASMWGYLPRTALSMWRPMR